MKSAKVLFLAALAFSFASFSMQDNCKVGTGTRLGHASCDPALDMNNPAAGACQRSGGTLEPITTENGEDALCVWNNNGQRSVCEQWAHARNECGPDQCAEWSLQSKSCKTLLVDAGQGGCLGQVGQSDASCATDGLGSVAVAHHCDCGAACSCVSEECDCDDACSCADCGASDACSCQGACNCGHGASQAGQACGAAQSDNAQQAACACGASCGCVSSNDCTCGDSCDCQACSSCGDAAGQTPVVGGDCSN